MTSRRTVWKLTRPQPLRTALLDMRNVRDPLKCDHGRVIFTGDIWFCKDCGEPVRDSDRRRQAEIDAVTSTW